MAKSRRAPSLVVRAPRHASRRVRPALAAEIRRTAKQSDAAPIDLDVKFVANDPTHPLGIASDNASEWNSLLISARAERGPQWDVATQRFMVDHGSHLYFDPTPLTFVEEPTPAPEEDNPPPGPSMGDPSLSVWQTDPRFAQYNGGNASISNMATPRASLRLQHHHQQQQQQQHHHHQPQPPLPHHPLNGYGNGIGMGNPYPYGITNGRVPEQQHYVQAQAQVQMPHSFYDGTHVPGHGQNQGQPPVHIPHAMTNGMALGGTGATMMARQMGINPNIGMSMEYGGGMMGPDMTPDGRRRTRSQQEGHMMEMGW